MYILISIHSAYFSPPLWSVLSTISAVIMVHSDIQVKIKQYLAGSFCNRDGELSHSSSQKFIRPLVKPLASKAQILQPGYRLADKRLLQMDYGEEFTFVGRVTKSSDYPHTA